MRDSPIYIASDLLGYAINTQVKGMNMTAKIIYSGTTHNIGGSNGSTRSVDGL